MACVRGDFSPESKKISLPIGLYDPQTASKLQSEHTTDINIKGKVHQCLALVDTGATCSCITQPIVKALNLTADGEEEVGGAHGVQLTSVYSVGLLIPSVGIVVENMNVMKVADLGGKLEAIIGMDILCRGVFQFDFSGNFVFCV